MYEDPKVEDVIGHAVFKALMGKDNGRWHRLTTDLVEVEALREKKDIYGVDIRVRIRPIPIE